MTGCQIKKCFNPTSDKLKRYVRFRPPARVGATLSTTPANRLSVTIDMIKDLIILGVISIPLLIYYSIWVNTSRILVPMQVFLVIKSKIAYACFHLNLESK